ncbi:hypothetical protein [Desulfitobacterium hafniense]|nr:hypothetical protein [Desulfitobacterium hafniense]
MTNEEFQRLVLEKLTGLEHGQIKLEERIDEVESVLTAKVEALDVKVNALDTKVEALDVKVNVLDTKVDALDVKVNDLDTKVEALDAKVNVLDTKSDALDAKIERFGRIQQDDVKGMLGLIKNKLDNISETQVIQGESINILALRQLQTESELAALKKAL